MTVWLGFLILIIFIAGLKFVMPQWNWMNDETFSGKITAKVAKVDALKVEAENSGENELKDNLILLRAAMDESETPRGKPRGILKSKEGNCIPLAPAPHSSPP